MKYAGSTSGISKVPVGLLFQPRISPGEVKQSQDDRHDDQNYGC